MGRRVLFWAESVTAVLSGFALVLTVVRHDWIEAVFGVDPDAGSGSFEWLIGAGLLVASVVLGVCARHEWRRLAAAR